MPVRRFDSEILADMAALEGKKLRPLTELLLSGGTDAVARLRVTELEARLQALRAELVGPVEPAPDPPA